MLIYGRDREIARWVGDQVGIEDFGPCVAIGVCHNVRIVAGAVFNRHSHPNIDITFATISPRWASPGAVRSILGYPFVQLGCKRITAVTETTNQPARAFLCRLGFKQEGIHPDAFPHGDGVSFGLLRKDASRWLAEEKLNVERCISASCA